MIPDPLPYSDVRRALAAALRSRKAVFRVLLAHASRATGVTYPSQLRIAKLAGVSIRTVKRSIGELRAIGAIVDVLHVRAGATKTLAAYAIHAGFLAPNSSSRKFPRKYSSPSCSLPGGNYFKQGNTPDPIVSRAIGELEAAGVPSWAARADVRAIGAAIVIARLRQVADRPAFVRGELRNPIGYVRACIRRDLPPPPPRSRSLDPEPIRAKRRNYAIGMQVERETERDRSNRAIDAARFISELKARFL